MSSTTRSADRDPRCWFIASRTTPFMVQAVAFVEVVLTRVLGDGMALPTTLVAFSISVAACAVIAGIPALLLWASPGPTAQGVGLSIGGSLLATALIGITYLAAWTAWE